MSPIKVIKRGIKEGDWNQVVQGYNSMTGDNVSPPVFKIEDDDHSAVTLGGIRRMFVQELQKREAHSTSDLTVLAEQPPDEADSVADPTTNQDPMIDDDGQYSGQLTTHEGDEVGHYGNQVRHITGEADPAMVEQNKTKAARTKSLKVRRSPHVSTHFDVQCNQCHQTFKSERKSSEIGEKCPKCLGHMRGKNESFQR